MARYDDILTAIEIGTSAIKVAMGGVDRKGTLSVLGFVETPTNDCVRKGEIIAANAVFEQLLASLNQVESMAGKAIGPTYLAVSGDHFGTANASATVPVTSAESLVSEEDIVVATQNARNLSLPLGKYAVHTCQRTYILDGIRRVSDPRGMIANRLSADIHTVYCDHRRIETLLRLLNNVLGERITDIVFSGIASFYGMVQEQTTRQGVLLIDVGAGVTDYVLFHDEGFMHSGQITVGCDHLANDLALGLRIPLESSRDMVREFGSALVQADAGLRQVAVPEAHEQARYVPEANIHRIMELRLHEMFMVIRNELDEQNLRALIGDGVFIGGGGALIPNITDLAAQVFKAPAHIARPSPLPGLDPEQLTPRMLTPIGLLVLSRQLHQMDKLNTQPVHKMVRQELGKLVHLFGRAINP